MKHTTTWLLAASVFGILALISLIAGELGFGVVMVLLELLSFGFYSVVRAIEESKPNIKGQLATIEFATYPAAPNDTIKGEVLRRYPYPEGASASYEVEGDTAAAGEFWQGGDELNDR